MKKKSAVVLFSVAFVFLLSVSVCFAVQGRYRREWNNQTMLRMEVPYEREHPTGRAAEYFAALVSERSGGQMEVAVTYNTKPGSANEIVTQLQFGGIAFAAVSFFDLCEDLPGLDRFVAAYASPEEAQDGYRRQREVIQEELSKERMLMLSCYRPDYRCIAGKREPGPGGEFGGMKIHAAKTAALTVYLVNRGVECENFGRTDLLRAVDSGSIDGCEMPLLLYGRAGYDKVMPYVWIYDEFLVPDMLMASSVSLGNLSDEQRRILQECAELTEDYQVKQLNEAQTRQWELLREKEAPAVLWSEREQVPR